MDILNKNEILAELPVEWSQDLMPEIENRVKQTGVKIVVLDDDPTGNQTVHNVIVLTEWSIPSLCDVFADPTDVVYILTNSRSISLKQAQKLNREIAQNLLAVKALSDRDFVIISRSDSTLRGHYPGEVNALAAALKKTFDGVLIIPFFKEGGRLTINNTHYVTVGNNLIPAGETEYARDPVFGYQNSDLRAWVSEKHAGSIKPDEVASITLHDIRVGGPKTVTEILKKVTGGQVCIVNAAAYRDLEVFVIGLLNAESFGKRFLYRTAASFARIRGGIQSRPLLKSVDMAVPIGGGLIIAGSYVEKTTQQLKSASYLSHLQPVTLSVPVLLNPTQRIGEIQRVIDRTEMVLKEGDDVLLFTSRDIAQASEETTAFEISQTISQALVTIVADLDTQPAWIVAKGGITASDIATQGLGVRHGYVLGQVLPGIPVWRLGAESRWPGLIYVIFPGNVGDRNTLTNVIRKLRG
jgi:uncharacterized protein YgbK (DUF1537 family)